MSYAYLCVFLLFIVLFHNISVTVANCGTLNATFVQCSSSNKVTVHAIFPLGGADPVTAHYAEHLAWLNAVGGERDTDRHSNAWTSDTAVSYWLSGSPDDLVELLETLSGVMDPIDLPRDFAEQERDIVLREYQMRMVGNPDAQAAEAMDAFLYHGNAIAASVIGTPDEIQALDYEDARTLHAETHRPETATLVVTGDVTKREVRRALRKAGWSEADGARAEIAPPSFDLASAAETTLRYPDADAAPRLAWRRVVTLPEPVPFDLLEARTALLRDILDTNLPGGLAGPLRFDAATARSFDARIRPIDENEIEIGFFAAPDQGVSLPELRVAFETALSDIAAAGIPDATFARVRDRFDDFWPDWTDADETDRWMADYVLDRVSSLRTPLGVRKLRRLEDDLSLDSTNLFLRQLAGEGRTAAAFIGPEESFE